MTNNFGNQFRIEEPGLKKRCIHFYSYFSFGNFEHHSFVVMSNIDMGTIGVAMAEVGMCLYLLLPSNRGQFLYLSSSVLVLPLDVTSPRDSYAWNYRELATLLTLNESLVMPGTRTTDPWSVVSASNN